MPRLRALLLSSGLIAVSLAAAGCASDRSSSFRGRFSNEEMPVVIDGTEGTEIVEGQPIFSAPGVYEIIQSPGTTTTLPPGAEIAPAPRPVTPMAKPTPYRPEGH